MTCGHAALAVLFWPLCALFLFVVLIAFVDGRQHRKKLRAACHRVARLERRINLQ